MPDVLTASALEARIRHCYEQLTEAERKLADVVLLRQRELLG